MAKNLADKTRQGVFWTALFNGIQYIIRVGSSIVLARILFPEDFGLMGIAMLSVQFARRLANFGFTMVLVQRKEVNRSHFDTVFYANTGFMACLTILVFSTAPWVAEFFANPKVEGILQVISFDFVIRGLFGVPRAILRRNMRFKQIGLANTVSSLISLLSPVVLAIMGYGVWSLVYGILLGSIANNFMMYGYARWFPGLRFERQALKDVFSFGMWVYVNTFLNYFVKNIDYILIGKFMPVAQLGLYERAFNLMNLPKMRLQQTIYNVLFSAFSKIQDDEKRIAQALARGLRYMSVVIYPIMIWMFFASPALIITLYGDKWFGAIEPLQIMCISGLIGTFTMLFFPVVMAKGLVAQRARRQAIYVVVLMGTVYYGLDFGLAGVAWSVVFAAFVFWGLMVQLIVKHTALSLRKLLMTQRTGVIYGGIQAAILYSISSFSGYPETSPLMLLWLSLFSIISFLLTHIVLRFNDVDDILREVLQGIPARFRKAPVISQLANIYLPKKS